MMVEPKGRAGRCDERSRSGVSGDHTTPVAANDYGIFGYAVRNSLSIVRWSEQQGDSRATNIMQKENVRLTMR